MITFLCPNGHRLTCPENLAGSAAECPDCGVQFHVPGEAVEPSRVTRTGRQAAADHHPASQIVFLCPNGHRLHGPHSLAGKAGQCPHCGSRFRIPPAEAEAASTPQGVSSHGSSNVTTSTAAEIPLQAIEEIVESGAAAPAVVAASTASAAAGSASARRSTSVGDDDLDFAALERLVQSSQHPVADGGAHAWAEVIERLWTLPGRGPIEMVLDSGETVVPEHFAAERSREGHCWIAVGDADGKFKVAVIAWERVVRVTARGLERLPDTFE